MKKIILLAVVVFMAVSVNAQILKDTFDSNILGWTETSGKDGEAVIKDGTMHMVGKKGSNTTMSVLFGVKTTPSFVETHCFAGFDVNKNFEIKCKANVKKITGNNEFGIILDYVDNGNFIIFTIEEGQASFVRYKEGHVIGAIINDLKIKEKKKADLDLSIKSSYQKLQFFVNGMLAIEARYVPISSSGIGFYIYGEHTVDFDDLEIIQ